MADFGAFSEGGTSFIEQTKVKDGVNQSLSGMRRAFTSKGYRGGSLSAPLAYKMFRERIRTALVNSFMGFAAHSTSTGCRALGLKIICDVQLMKKPSNRLVPVHPFSGQIHQSLTAL